MIPAGAQFSAPQAARPKASKGPRALGLVRLLPNGHAQLIPVIIMFNGEFYDASAYKAAPVPMALESGTVYEAVKTGVSQGLFTVKGALHSEDNKIWTGQGTWQTNESIAAAAEAKKKREAAETAAAKAREEAENKPPVLRRAGSPKPEPTPAPEAPKPSAPAPPVATAPPKPAPEIASADDPDRPVLRRGKPQPEEEKPATPLGASKQASTGPTKPTPSANNGIQFIPAISDAGGPDPRPYAYTTKPEEEQKFRKNMLAMAAGELRSEEKSPEPTGPAHRATAKPAAAKRPQPEFSDVQLHILDLTTSNEPVLVLTAKAKMPVKAADKTAAPASLFTLVAREDIYGELHKAFFSVTDAQHLDVTPNLEFIDAVDADGDGRGELLFRQVADNGTAYSLYRVIGNQLWPLFQGTPGR